MRGGNRLIMSRRSTFYQADAERLLRAALAAGLKPTGCTMGPDGSIKLDFCEGGVGHLQNPLNRLLGAS